MDSRGTGLCLSIGVVAAIVGYVLWQVTLGFDTKVDDIATILKNSAAGSGTQSLITILVGVGLVVHVAGLLALKGTAKGTCESLGTFCVTVAVIIWVVGLGSGIALTEMGEKYVSYLAGAQAGNAAAVDAVASITVAGGFIQAASVGSGQLGTLLASLGWLLIGFAYRGVDFKGALSFIPLGWLAIVAGVIGLVSTIIISNVVSIEASNQISGIVFLLIMIWSVLVGVKLVKDSK